MSWEFSVRFDQVEAICEIWSESEGPILQDDIWTQKALAKRELQIWSSFLPVRMESTHRYARLGFRMKQLGWENIFWSLSGTKEFSALAISQSVSVGIDIEKRDRKILDVEWGLTEIEKERMSEIKTEFLKHFLYLLLWVQKEARYKSFCLDDEFKPESIQAAILPNESQLNDWFHSDFKWVQNKTVLFGAGPLVGSVAL